MLELSTDSLELIATASSRQDHFFSKYRETLFLVQRRLCEDGRMNDNNSIR